MESPLAFGENLMNHLPSSSGDCMSQAGEVLCAGIVVADHVSTPIDHLPTAGELVLADRLQLTLGGCAANVAVDLARMDVSAAVAGRVGGDLFGRIVADLLREARVDVTSLQVSPEHDTSQTLIVNVVGEDRRFIHSFGANAAFSAADIPAERVARCRVLYLGGFLVMDKITQEELIPVFEAARRSGARTVLDVVTPGPGHYLARLDRLLPHVDVFLPNDQEGYVITGERDPLRQAEAFRRLGVGTAIVTLGSGGSVLVGEGVRLRAGAYQVPFVDGSGGGDAFAAGYIYGLLHDLPPQECLKVASALGASCVRSIGTTTGVFTRQECEAFVQGNSLPVDRL
jgi:sugar/nucleoside kinase (ribokinase family)